jgi:hypothetical protein
MYEKPIQKQAKLKHKPLDVQKIKTNVEIKLDHPLLMGQKILFLNFDLLVIL